MQTTTAPPAVIENGRAAVDAIEEAMTFIGEAIKGLGAAALEVNLPEGDEDARDSINAFLTRVSFTEDVFRKYAADVTRGVQMIPRTAAAPREPKRDHFAVLDPVMQRWVEVKGAVAVMLVALDGDPDAVAAETLRRYASADLDRMSAALDAAWGYFVRGEGDAA
jgi:hypothetical protein